MSGSDERPQWFETTLELRNKSCEVFFSFSQNWLQVKLDQWVHRHKKWAATGGNYVEEVNLPLDIDVQVTSA